MKKLKIIIVIILILMFSIGYSQTTYYANQVTITWDAPTTYENGDPLPSELEMFYDVYIREKGGEQIFQVEVANPPYTITFPTSNRKYDIGVLAKYQVDTDWIYSTILWSIEEGWDVGFFVPVAPVSNLRIE